MAHRQNACKGYFRILTKNNVHRAGYTERCVACVVAHETYWLCTD